MDNTDTQKKFKCTTHITYEFIVTAESKEEAENEVFDKMSDDIGKGIIPMDIYDSMDCFPIPLLESVEVVSFKSW